MEKFETGFQPQTKQRPDKTKTPSASAVLSAADLQCFEEHGYVKLPAAFPHEEAVAMQAFMWEELGALHSIQKEDTSTWDRSIKGLQRSRRYSIYRPIASLRMCGAIDQLLGRGNWILPKDWGKFLISFPLKYTHGRGDVTTFHCDIGAKYWNYYVPDFPVCEEIDPTRVPRLWVFTVFSDLAKNGGGTVLLAGSHRLTPHYIAQHSAEEWQLRLSEKGPKRFFRECKPDRELYPWKKKLADTEEGRAILEQFMSAPQKVDGFSLQAIPITGKPGDAFITHPLLGHAQVRNRADVPRFMRVTGINGKVSHSSI